MKAGFSRKIITPELGVTMAGHPGTKHAEKIRDDLFVRAVAVSNDMVTFVFASLDVLFVESGSVGYIRDNVSRRSNVNSDCIFISATHTHSGPMTTGLFGKEQESAYIDYLHSQTIEAAVEAVNNMEPCTAGFGKTAANGFAFNARFLMDNGRVETHPFKYDKGIVAPEGPVDDSLSFLYFYDESHGLLGGMINFANHPQIMERQNSSISADFPGEMERSIQNEQNKDAVILFLNGTCGDICPVNAMDNTRCEVGEQWLTFMGWGLAKKAKEILEIKDEVPSNNILNCLSKEVELTIRDIPSDLIYRALEFLKHHNEEDKLLVSNYGVEPEGSQFLSLEEYLQTDEWHVQQYTDILELNKIREKSNTEKITITALELCGIGMVLLPFEVFVEFGLEIKSRSPYKDTVVAELANGSFGYLPTEKAFQREGGYETITLRSSRYKEESGKLIVESAIELLNGLYSSKINNVNTQYKI